MNRKRLMTSAVGALVAAAIAGSVAYATIPGPDGTINGCYRTSEDDQKGQLRVVNDPTACRSNESPISWNQVGPRGEQGPQGERGIQGPPGTDGADGADGVNVTSAALSKGDANCPDGGSQFTAAGNNITFACNGAPGQDGQNGPKGDTGAQGLPGVSGHEVVSQRFTFSPLMSSVTGGAICPSGKKVLGGGFDIPPVIPDITAGYSVLASHPSGGDSWIVRATNDSAVNRTLEVYAICAFVD